MADRTKIEFCDATWNPIRGCSMDLTCSANCWARRFAHRQRGSFPGFTDADARWTGRVALIESHLQIPIHWRNPRRIAVALMGDLFHPNLPDSARDRVFAVMALCPQHTFLVLTKRAREMRKWFSAVKFDLGEQRRLLLKQFGWPLPNIWLGTSASTQAELDERWSYLRDTPAALRWLSLEPLLAEVDLGDHLGHHLGCDGTAYAPAPCDCGLVGRPDWVVLGGETGPGARPMHPDWARKVRDDCEAAGVPFFFKGWGEQVPASQCSMEVYVREFAGARCRDDEMTFIRVGKKAAGRLLDGREWNEVPEVRRCETQNRE